MVTCVALKGTLVRGFTTQSPPIRLTVCVRERGHWGRRQGKSASQYQRSWWRSISSQLFDMRRPRCLETYCTSRRTICVWAGDWPTYPTSAQQWTAEVLAMALKGSSKRAREAKAGKASI